MFSATHSVKNEV